MMPHQLGRLQSTSLAAMIAVAACAPLLRAQDGGGATIDPGMTRAQVEARLGSPKVVRAARGATYLFYANECGLKCGTDDLVVLEEDVVTDALFRSPVRHYSGRSSSPVALSSSAARPTRLERERARGILVNGEGVASSAPGSIVIGGAPALVDSTSAANVRWTLSRRAAGARRASQPRSSRSRRPLSAIRISPTSPASGAVPASPDAPKAAPLSRSVVPARPGRIDAAGTGARSTTGPVDARAAVHNAGAPLYPKATSVKPSPGVMGADSAGGRVPFQGAQLAPTDSASASILPGQHSIPAPATQPAARPTVPRPDSTRP